MSKVNKLTLQILIVSGIGWFAIFLLFSAIICTVTQPEPEIALQEINITKEIINDTNSTEPKFIYTFEPREQIGNVTIFKVTTTAERID